MEEPDVDVPGVSGPRSRGADGLRIVLVARALGAVVDVGEVNVPRAAAINIGSVECWNGLVVTPRGAAVALDAADGELHLLDGGDSRRRGRVERKLHVVQISSARAVDLQERSNTQGASGRLPARVRRGIAELQIDNRRCGCGRWAKTPRHQDDQNGNYALH